MKVLHITNWYPNKENPYEALFVREHFRSLDSFTEKNELIHIEVKDSARIWKTESYSMEQGSQSFVLSTFLARSWKVRELLTFLILFTKIFLSRKHKRYDAVCFHVAYPLLTYMKLVKWILGDKMLMLEHWTAYHFNFNLPSGSRVLNPIRNIFRHDVPLITVSKALGEDIRSFSGVESLKSHVLPNVVDSELFCFKGDNPPVEPVLFMLNYWRPIKSPFVILEAFKLLIAEIPRARLVIGGYGPLWSEMENFVKRNKLEENVKFKGKMSKHEIAEQHRNSTFFLHSSTYETFSVVTAEALMCGTPVVVSNIPAIAEYVNESNGRLVSGNDPLDWHKAILSMINEKDRFNRKHIREQMTKKFSKQAVGAKFLEILTEVIKTKNG